MKLYIGTAKGLFIYTPDAKGTAWEMSGPLLSGWDIYSVYRDAGGRLYVGTNHYAYGATIRTSDDDGKTWNQTPTRPEYPAESGWKMNRIWQLVGHPKEANTIFAGVEEAGLFVSRDRGDTWAELGALSKRPGREKWNPGAGGLCCHTILIDPKNAQRMYLGISAVGFFRSLDGGATWTNFNKTLQQLPTGSNEEESGCCVHKVVLDPADAGKLFMQYHGGVYASVDAGETWQHIETGLPNNFGFPIAILKSGELFVVPLKDQGERYFAGEHGQVYRSKDRGASWQPLNVSGEQNFAGVLRDAMTTDASRGVYLGTSSGEVFASADAGESWQRLHGTLPRINCVKIF